VSVDTCSTRAVGALAGRNARPGVGAYITDGTSLCEVTRLRVTGTNFVKVTVEDCRTFARHEVTMAEIRKHFRLVRAADRPRDTRATPGGAADA
jgi:hypothetical protein